MPTFKVLRGAHSEGGKIYGRGSTVQSKSDLDVKFNRQGMPPKYRRVSDNGPQDSEPEESYEPSQSAPPVDVETYPDFQSMKVRELRSFAEAEEIDLSGCGNDKQSIVARIHEHLE